ncbi:RimK family alpha-L-glutamate ligase [Candidatus Woesearchaeota archaeon]|jgi:ribosomal protein S6--L-glutamate ligase|nr:RimK family alpha-L-glutamate ligase [Candidatus Woesearchaeota archaeon]MBT4387470.1 RimK family alpha-L-glutamate ligase [Candidatus Woesearchaeota archaeon]MBT4595880.1 RimK family alpha-L-glutamate ligase [Candidatus Woesearchaeota archaeon]MBT5741271.1 RimK family alpha-L-glutamate ligase [Candidatus Woesearchaeota archaeon]MBT6505956.1 RimK family alpha-L-glutamate ligase [Candidatus Woesearchaeota archaeon]
MKAAIISLNGTSSKLIAESMNNYFDKVDMLNIKKFEVLMKAGSMQILYDGESLKKYDCILARGSFKYAQILHAISKTLEQFCYMPMSAESFLIGHDKFLSQIAFNTKNISMPVAYYASSDQATKRTLNNISYPIVMKMPNGTHGKGVMFADSKESAKSILDAMGALKQPFIIQEFIDTGGKDIRAIVVGDKVVACMERKSISGENRSNIHAGGKGYNIELDDITKDMCVRTSKTLGCDISAIDIMMDSKGPLVLELNLSPGLQGIMKATKIDVADHMAKFLFEKTRDLKIKSTKKETGELFQELGLSDKKIKNGFHEMITTLDHRGKRILLPESVSKLGVLNEVDEYVIKVAKNKIIIEKFDLNNV